MTEIKELIGKTLKSIDRTDDELIFHTKDGLQYKMYHSQDCCEHVSIDEIFGDLNDLVGSPILSAEESSNTGNNSDTSDWPESVPQPEYRPESYTWTFYKLATNKGYVTIRWYGSSNGYYSESVYFAKL